VRRGSNSHLTFADLLSLTHRTPQCSKVEQFKEINKEFEFSRSEQFGSTISAAHDAFWH